jgi:hypothetical protein
MRKERIPFIVVLFLLAVTVITLQGCYSEAMPEWAEGFAYDSTEIYPIYVGEDGSAFVAATFGGEPLALMFDTSQSSGLLMTDNLVAQMGLQVMEQDSDDEDDLGVRYRLPSFTAFGRQWEDQVVQPASEQTYNGSIGPQFINGSRFTLDYGKQLLAVSESPLPENLIGENVVPMEHSDHSMLPVVRGWVNDEEVLIELDTGSRQTVIDMFLARKLGLDPDDTMHIPEVIIGTYTFEVKSAASGLLPVSDDLRRIRLGSDVLSHMILTVDYISESVAIKPIISNSASSGSNAD